MNGTGNSIKLERIFRIFYFSKFLNSEFYHPSFGLQKRHLSFPFYGILDPHLTLYILWLFSYLAPWIDACSPSFPVLCSSSCYVSCFPLVFPLGSDLPPSIDYNPPHQWTICFHWNYTDSKIVKAFWVSPFIKGIAQMDQLYFHNSLIKYKTRALLQYYPLRVSHCGIVADIAFYH